jgi:hypothetical protein
MVTFTAATIGTRLGLKGRVDSHEIRAQAFEHCLDHMVRANAKYPAIDLCWQMPVSQVPCEASQLFGFSMSDLYHGLWRGLYSDPSPVFQSQPVSIRHGKRLRQIEKKLFALICYQANPPAMTLFEQKRDGSRSLVLRPAPGALMNRCAA